DRESAVLLGNRTMGAMSDLVSQFEISPLYSQINYQDHPVRVSPLVYADLFKWLQNREQGIPAYVIVDMTSQDAQVVRLEGDKAIKYSESEPLARNIDRYVQLKYPFYMFGEKSFEIDDEGNAWWICPVRDFTIGLFGGETVSRAVLVNASTGECQDLDVSEVPEWVDRVYPANLLIQQYNWSGKYKDGWINSWLGQNGVVQTTPGTDGTLGYNYIAKDDDVWMYTGVTSATGDNSIVGFVLVNQRTSESHFYSVAGATEDSAMQSAEGQVQNLRYQATFPILINVSNTPTYFMALKDDAGLVKKYAMVDIRSYQNVAVGDTVADTQKAYMSLIAANGSGEGSASSDSAIEASGTIKTIAQAVIEGNSHFYVTLDGDSRIYDFALPGMLNVVSYAVGDTITFRYIEGDPTSVAQEIVEAAVNSTQDSSGQGGSSASDAEDKDGSDGSASGEEGASGQSEEKAA
ncbi:Tat pathway signal sequence, partial [Slackia piriformis]|uniref:Tat pathway signal sequence n=1 Tax=Slackia piriformis TaxID=626934 RepID=UPI0023F0F785